jgi:hypothetical protein
LSSIAAPDSVPSVDGAYEEAELLSDDQPSIQYPLDMKETNDDDTH